MPHTLLQRAHRGGHLKIAKSGHARQLIIFAHGGWKASDGTTTIRPTSTVFYYVPDGGSTVGHTLFNDIIANSGLAYYGNLIRPADLTKSQADMIVKNDPTADPLEVMRRVEVLNQPVVDKAKGGSTTSNYAVYKHDDGAGKIQKCLDGEIDDDLDIATNDSDHKCHLSDFFNMFQRNNLGYHVVHFVACREAR